MRLTVSYQHGCFSVLKIAPARRPSVSRPGSTERAVSGRKTRGQRLCVQSALGYEGLETGPLVSCGPLRRMEPSRIGQAGPDQVDGPAQFRVGLRLRAVGPGPGAG
jgi:hypothetical protein